MDKLKFRKGKVMLKYSFIAILVVFLVSCKPDPLTFTIQGTVHDDTFNQPLENGVIEFISYPAGSLTGNLIESKSLNQNGSFEFEVKREQVEKYELILQNDNYFPEKRTLFFSELKPNEAKQVNLNTTAKSYAKFIVKNQNNPSSSDELKFLKFSGKTNCDDCCPNQYSFFEGAQINESFTCANDGNTYLSFYYWVNGNDVFVHDSIQTIAFDTTTYEIIY